MTTLESLFTIVLNQSWKIAAVVLVILAIRWFFGRRLSPTVRHALWIFVALAALMPASLLPRPTIWLPADERQFAMVGNEMVADEMIGNRLPDDYIGDSRLEQPTRSPDAGRLPTFVTDVVVTEHFSEPNIATTEKTFPWFTILVNLWCFGFAIMLALSLGQLFLFRRKLSCATPVASGEIFAVMKACQTRMGIVRAVPLLESKRIAAPILLGLWRPRIVLPSVFVRSCTPEQFEHFFMHELSHLKRHDIFFGWTMSLLCLVHWFNPLLWIAVRKMNDDAEEATDQLALSRLPQTQRTRYGKTLLSIAERINLPTFRKGLPVQTPGIIGIMESSSQLTRRIEMITQKNHWKYRWVLLAVGLCLLVSIVTLTQVRHVEAQTQQEPEHVNPGTTVSTPSSPALSEENDDEKPKRHHTNIPPGVPTVDLRGKVLLPDGSPVAGRGISIHGFFGDDPGSFFAMTETKKDGTFQIEVVPDQELSVNVSTGNENDRRFSLKPFIVVAKEGMEPLILTLEEGIPVRGAAVYENGQPAENCLLYFRDKPLGVIKIQRKNGESTQNVAYRQHTKTDGKGEYEVYLLPGEYTTFSRSEPIIIETTDTEKHLDLLTFPTPIFVELESADGSLAQMHSIASDLFGNDSSSPHSESPIRRDPGNPFVKMGDVYAYESAGKEGTLFIVDNVNKQGTVETITAEMVGTTQHFKLKPMGSVTATLVDSDNKPMVNMPTRLTYEHQHSGVSRHIQRWSCTHGETDAEGKVTLPVLSGKTSIALNLPYSLSEQARKRHSSKHCNIDKELELAPGENFDFGTIKLIRVFGKLSTERGNVQINGVDAPDSPIQNDRRAVTVLWADKNGDYDILLPPGHYRFHAVTIIGGRAVDYVLSISEESKEIHLDFDDEGKGTILP